MDSIRHFWTLFRGCPIPARPAAQRTGMSAFVRICPQKSKNSRQRGLPVPHRTICLTHRPPSIPNRTEMDRIGHFFRGGQPLPGQQPSDGNVRLCPDLSAKSKKFPPPRPSLRAQRRISPTLAEAMTESTATKVNLARGYKCDCLGLPRYPRAVYRKMTGALAVQLMTEP